MFNQKAVTNLQSILSQNVDLSDIDANCAKTPWEGKSTPLVMKINYKWNEIPFYDTSYMMPDISSLR